MNMILKFIGYFSFSVSYSLMAQVGVNTDNPQTMLDINGNLSLNASTLSLNDGSNAVVGGNYTFFNISGPVNNFEINTIQPLTDVDGQIITLVNTTSNSMILVDNDGAGTNSIYCSNGSDLVLIGIYSTVTLQYNKTLERWTVLRHVDGERAGQGMIYNNSGKTDISTNSNNFSDMGSDMSITFIPRSTIVYVNISISGSMAAPVNADSQGYADFMLRKTVGIINTDVTGFTTIATDIDYGVLLTPWYARLAMYPVTVTPGESTTLKIRWRRGGNNPNRLDCAPTSLPNNSHRSITIFD
ncbi:hypothetical protein Aeqsu_2226 [Aequorivita sublithincola DSM 14238]|uniref:Uncharacterized protein n=1 Tax=Aequorivita sublithincola (strain DSM 14238 / LMG 21431 / ACAM 643 / 9-3) TaxID=746697 RepID=I3YXG8_AEQSU|nr:hypothetical protein [Aequorivita sublithincola]AFL81686.1 hypothetical protein Aeqsu_2226 [Aequorivita sublithincola DSM 14238]